MATKTQSRMASESALFLLVLGAIVVVLNLLGVFVNARYDATEKELFSLSDGSKRLAKSLDDQLEIRAYFSTDLPPPHNATERYVRDLLAEYRDASGGKITLRVIHPESDEDKEAAERDGVRRVQDQKLEADSFSVQEGYRGISFHYLGDSRAIPSVDTTAGLEYEITQKIKDLTGEKVKIGVLSVPEGPTLEKGLSALKQYLPTYELVEVKPDNEIDKDLKALLVIQPPGTISAKTLRYINQYVMRGGSLGIFGGGINVSTEGGTPSATPIDSGLNTLLEKWGVTLDNRIVADAQCGRARMPTRIGIPIAVPYPPVPIVTFDDKQREHPALFRLDQVAMPYPVRLALNDNLSGSNVKREVLSRSTPSAWLLEGDTIDLNTRERWEIPGYNGPYTLGVALEGELPSAFGGESVSSEAPTEGSDIEAPEKAEKSVHVLVFGTGLQLIDQFMPPPQPGNPQLGAGVAFALNAIDWLAQDSDLIEIRAKSVEEPTLEVPQNVKEAEATIRAAIEEQDEAKAQEAFEERKQAMEAWDQKKRAYRWGNTLAIPLLFAFFGVVRWRVRLARKQNLKL